MSGGYSYTSISVHEDGAARIGVSFLLDSRASVQAYGLDGDRVHLGISLGEVAVMIGPADPAAVTSEDARIARHLAEQAAAYAAAVERLAATVPGTADAAA